MNQVIRPEMSGSFLGVDGRFFNVIGDDERIRNQKFTSEWREYTEGKEKYRIKFTARHDDELNNGHESFAITGETQHKQGNNWREDSCGCIHDEIKKHFPEVSHLIKWHLCSTDGPLHYIANTIYLAGNRDHWGLMEGEASQSPKHQQYFVKFGDSPIEHKVSNRLRQFILSDPEYIIDKVEHPKENATYLEKYQFAGMDCQWHECPFNTLAECQQWAEALTECKIEWVICPTLFGEGKVRELDSARKTAIWPEATDDELMSDKFVLEKLLMDRLPGLLEAFRHDIESTGFLFNRESV